MAHSYVRGDKVPKSIPFMKQLPVGIKEKSVKKGDAIYVDGVPHKVTAIIGIELKGHYVQVIGKCKQLEVKE
ncbi:hypothetical protein [Halalkalibacter krulwichiae]|uniref:Uncharacterized protein n=1 Tax=Halalkalibacter krulwichiae TaxID=199441 RepID=A0A1X9MEC0_9BACI|nr:hypothetical protein [Halalkalibacter krulwichiae]ARK28772.1 hypothetical protein BkAM31D_02295 [Halalkalibacter krulwichiae]